MTLSGRTLFVTGGNSGIGLAAALAKHPLGRVGAKEEVADAVLFLCRDASFTTGHAFPVDGGWTTG